LQRKGKGGDGEQVKVCLACFSWATWQIRPASGCAQDGAGVKRPVMKESSKRRQLESYKFFVMAL